MYQPIQLYFCADEFEIDKIRSTIISRLGHSNVHHVQSILLSFFQVAHYNTITGTARIDDNNNGCDTHDRGLINVPIKLSDTSGKLIIPLLYILKAIILFTLIKALFTLTPHFPYPYFTINPANTLPPLLILPTAYQL